MLTKEDLELVLDAATTPQSNSDEQEAAVSRVRSEVAANLDGTVWLPQGPLPGAGS